MTKHLALLLPAALLISACSTAVTQTYTNHGNAGYRLTCGGFFGDGDMGSCYEKAGEICQSRGYKVIQTSVSSIIIECRSDGNNELPQQ